MKYLLDLILSHINIGIFAYSKHKENTEFQKSEVSKIKWMTLKKLLKV